jgi:hypothetical protein
MMGNLRFEDSGCVCIPKPYPPIPIFVDGQPAGQLKVFGNLTITLSGGTHTWSTDTNTDPTSVVIRVGHTSTVDLTTNDGCADGCDIGDARSGVRQ